MATSERYPTITVETTAPSPAIRPPLQEAAVTSVGHGVVVTGLLTASEHVIIDGTVDGEVLMPDYGVAVSLTGRIKGEVCARTITVLGLVEGALTASSLIELRSTAVVTGRLAAPNVLIEEGARFNGGVAPDKTDAALAVVRHRLQQPKPTSNRP